MIDQQQLQGHILSDIMDKPEHAQVAGSIGLILSIPLTAFAAALLYRSEH